MCNGTLLIFNPHDLTIQIESRSSYTNETRRMDCLDHKTELLFEANIFTFRIKYNSGPFWPETLSTKNILFQSATNV